MQLLFAFTLINSVNAMCEGASCCDGKGTQWIETLEYCKAMEVEGKCGSGGCYPFHVAPNNDPIFCCTRPHHAEQKPAVAEQQVEVQKPAVAEQQVEVQTDSKADAMCEGASCCDGKGTQWIETLEYCKAMEVEGKCGSGGCYPFHVAPNNDPIFCCTRPHHAEQKPVAEQQVEVQKPAVAEQQVEVQTDSNNLGCSGPDCCTGTWYDNLPGCKAEEANGHCGGCDKFYVNGAKYCCRKHWNDSVMI